MALLLLAARMLDSRPEARFVQARNMSASIAHDDHIRSIVGQEASNTAGELVEIDVTHPPEQPLALALNQMVHCTV